MSILWRWKDHVRVPHFHNTDKVTHAFWPPWSLNVPRPSKIGQHQLWTRSNLPWGGEGFLTRQQGLCDEGFTMRVLKTRLMSSNSLPLLICEIFLYTLLSTSTWCPKMIRYFYSISPSHLPISSPLMVFNTLTNTCALVPVLATMSHSAWELNSNSEQVIESKIFDDIHSGFNYFTCTNAYNIVT